jgi:lipopolysaccharide transport system permease protein
MRNNMSIETVVISSSNNGNQLKELIKYKDLILFLVLRDIKVFYKQSILGFGWVIIRPVFTMIIFTIIFGKLAKIPSDGLPYPVFSYSALVPWTYFSIAASLSSGSLLANSSIMTKVYFPRILLPVIPICSKLVDLLLSFIVLIFLLLFYKVQININIALLPIMFIVLVLFSLGLGILLSGLTVQYRDVNHALSFLLQGLMYAAPIAWPLSLIPENYRLLYSLYPMVGIIEGFRACLLGKEIFPWDLVTISFTISLLLLVLGIVLFYKLEKNYADVV